MFEFVLHPMSMTPHNVRFFMTSFLGNKDVITCHLGRRYCVNFFTMEEYKSHVVEGPAWGYEKVKI